MQTASEVKHHFLNSDLHEEKKQQHKKQRLINNPEEKCHAHFIISIWKIGSVRLINIISIIMANNIE